MAITLLKNFVHLPTVQDPIFTDLPSPNVAGGSQTPNTNTREYYFSPAQWCGLVTSKIPKQPILRHVNLYRYIGLPCTSQASFLTNQRCAAIAGKRIIQKTKIERAILMKKCHIKTLKLKKFIFTIDLKFRTQAFK